MSIARGLLNLLRLLVVVQLIIGIGIWIGSWVGLTGVHVIIGFLFVLTLWAIALIALFKRRLVGVAIVAILWGVLLVGFGFAQRGIMVGNAHWIIRVIHLLIALGAMPFAERLTRAVSTSEAVA